MSRTLPGAAPGQYTFETGEAARLILYCYDEHELQVTLPESLKDAHDLIGKKEGWKYWLQVVGYGNTAFFGELKDLFGIHPLELEDVLSGNSRPKLEQGKHHKFDISRVLFYDEEDQLHDEQFNLFYKQSCLISLQEKELNCFQPVLERLKVNGSLMRRSPLFYLFYAINDAIIDNYFPLLERIEVRLENIEDELFDKPHRQHLTDIQMLRRDLLSVRKVVYAEREILSELIRNMETEDRDQMGLYLKDAYDHCQYIAELIESQKEIAFSLIDIYLSSVNNRMNEVMKVLTVISSIFIPLSFIAGLYGMNFIRHTEDGKTLTYNMPELYEPYGYITVLGIMTLIVIGQLIFFRRKGWI